MAADAYIQSAITHLHSAIGDLQQQIAGLGKQTKDLKQQLQQEIQQLERQRKVHEVELLNLDDDAQKQLVLDHMSHLHHDTEDKKGRMAQLDSELATAIQRKTSMYNDLQNLARQLNAMMASPDLR